MPRLPDVTSYGERPVAVDPITRTGWSGTTNTGELSGKGVTMIGDTLHHVSKEIDVANARYDTVVAEDAMNQYLSKRQDLSIGKDGYVNKLGKDALNGKLIDDYISRLSANGEDISGGLSNSRQKEMFRRRQQVVDLQFKHDLLGHVVNEQDKYSSQVFEDTAKLESANAVDRYKDENGRNTSILRFDAALQRESERRGWGDMNNKESHAYALRQQWMSTTQTGIIYRQLADGDDQTAEQYYKKIKEDGFVFTKEDEINISKALEIGSTRGKAFRSADNIISRTNGDLSASLDAASREYKNDPKVREATEQRILQLVHFKNAGEQEADTRHFNSVMQDVKAGREVSPSDQVAMSRIPGAAETIRALKEEKIKGPPSVSDPEAVNQFSTISNDWNKLNSITDSQFQEMAMKMNTKDRSWAVDVWENFKKARSGDKESSIKIEDNISFEQRMFDTLESHKLIKPSKNGKTGERELSDEDKLMLNDFRRDADQLSAEWQRAHGAKHIPPEVKQKIMDDLAVKKYLRANVGGTLWDNSGVEVRKMTPDQAKKAYIPIDNISPDSIDKMYNYAKSKGIVPNNMNIDVFKNNYKTRIQRAYFVDQTIGDMKAIDGILSGEM